MALRCVDAGINPWAWYAWGTLRVCSPPSSTSPSTHAWTPRTKQHSCVPPVHTPTHTPTQRPRSLSLHAGVLRFVRPPGVCYGLCVQSKPPLTRRVYCAVLHLLGCWGGIDPVQVRDIKREMDSIMERLPRKSRGARSELRSELKELRKELRLREKTAVKEALRTAGVVGRPFACRYPCKPPSLPHVPHAGRRHLATRSPENKNAARLVQAKQVVSSAS